MIALDDALRELVRDELRNVLRSELPALLTGCGGAAIQGQDTPRYLTTDETAKIANVNPETVREWVRAGTLHEHRAGRLLRIRLDELERYLSRSQVATKITGADLEDRATSLVRRKNVVG